MTHILIIEDEELNRELLIEYLDDTNYTISTAENGKDGWEKLQTIAPVDVILLDRMMPEMDGIEFMKLLKADERYQRIPVVMQTASCSSKEIMEGLHAGVYYYLPKPYDEDTLLRIVAAAMADDREALATLDGYSDDDMPTVPTDEVVYHFRTHDEADDIAAQVARYFPEPNRALIGMTELCYNAIEHGNLEITFEEKGDFILNGNWKDELRARQTSAKYLGKQATLTLHVQEEQASVSISDEGKGFNYRPFLNIDPIRVTKLNGRGIAIAKLMSFDSLEYFDGGRRVVGTCYFNKLSKAS